MKNHLLTSSLCIKAQIKFKILMQNEKTKVDEDCPYQFWTKRVGHDE